MLRCKVECMSHIEAMQGSMHAAGKLGDTIGLHQGWVIRHRRIIRRIVFITYLPVFFKLLRIIRFWALNEFCSHKPPRAPQKHSQALSSPPEALPSPLEPPRGTPSPSERSMITAYCYHNPEGGACSVDELCNSCIHTSLGHCPLAAGVQ